MADPFAPPSDTPRRRRAPAAEPAPAPAYEPEPQPAAWREPREPHEAREPAHPGMFWVVAAIGVGMISFASLLSFFSYVGDLAGEDVAPAIFSVFGSVALSVGLALAAVLQRGLSIGVRVALLLGAGYFAASGSGFGILASLSGNPFF